jgi:hypothetical protein
MQICGGRAQTLNYIYYIAAVLDSARSPGARWFSGRALVHEIQSEDVFNEYSVRVPLFLSGVSRETARKWNMCAACVMRCLQKFSRRCFIEFARVASLSLAARRTKLICQHVVFNIYLKDGFISRT